VRWYSKRSGHSVADAAEHTGAEETVQAVGEHVARDPKTLEQLIEAMASDPYVAFRTTLRQMLAAQGPEFRSL
jgi:hypothetical protein